jgi:hypothetical protein
MDDSEILDSLFREAVSAADAFAYLQLLRGITMGDVDGPVGRRDRWGMQSDVPDRGLTHAGASTRA